jgi:hypothetical protein
VVEAFLWELFGAAFLLVGVVGPPLQPRPCVDRCRHGDRVRGLFGAVAYELIDEALKTQTVGRVGVFVLLGACTSTDRARTSCQSRVDFCRPAHSWARTGARAGKSLTCR